MTNSMYQLSKKMGDNGESFRFWKFANIHFVPTYQQLRLHNAVSKALDAKLFYVSEIQSFVAKEMADMLSEEIINANCPQRPVAGGFFGYDVYAMKEVVESQRRAKFHSAWLQMLMNEKGLNIGMKVKGPFVWGSKTYSSLEIMGIDCPEGMLSVVGTIRGSRNKYQFVIGAGYERFLALFQYAAA